MLSALVLAALVTGAEPRPIAEQTNHWRSDGFAQMVPAILPALSADARHRVEVWIHLPDDAKWKAGWNAQQKRWLPVWPAGTVADRLGLELDGDQWKIGDVRGTTFLPGGAEEFHVLRPAGSGLEGQAWPRGDTHAQRRATEELVKLVRARDPGDEKFFRDRNACARCHPHQKPASRVDKSDDLPFGATDGSGLYVLLDVLGDETQVDDSRGRDANANSPYVHFRCDIGSPKVKRGGGAVEVSCPKDGVPIACYELSAALASNQPHARDVCSARRYLFDHADDSAKRAFAGAFAECGLK